MVAGIQHLLGARHHYDVNPDMDFTLVDLYDEVSICSVKVSKGLAAGTPVCLCTRCQMAKYRLPFI